MISKGDHNVLNHELSQRLSKIEKPDPSSDEKSKIAWKIFESVDRKAANPQTRVESKKGVNRSRQLFAEELTLTPDEMKILESPYEILLVHTPDGRLQSVTLGKEHEVGIPPQIPEGAILSHNHPSGRGPSDTDLKSVLSLPGMTLRIVARNEVGRREIFSMQFHGRMTKGEIQAYTQIYLDQCNEAGDQHAGRRESLALISRIIGDRFRAVSRIPP